MPIAGRDKDLKTVYYAGAAAGLPWAAALGRYAAEVLIDKKADYDEFFFALPIIYLWTRCSKPAWHETYFCPFTYNVIKELLGHQIHAGSRFPSEDNKLHSRSREAGCRF